MNNRRYTLYEFLLLPEEKQYYLIFNEGTFLDSLVERYKRYALYAIYMFYVEVEYDSISNRVSKKKVFKSGETLDKYVSIKGLDKGNF